MTTKAQERKALEQIRKIVEGLGEDSYLSMAFEGCFEMAEQNIDNDWAFSPKHRINCLECKVVELESDIETLITKNNSKDTAINSMQEDCNYWREHCKEAQNNYHNEEARCESLEEQIKEQEQQILELKAKLYDYMVK